MGRPVLPIEYQFTQAQVDAGDANNLSGVRIVIVGANNQPTGVVYESGASGSIPIVSSAIKNNFAGTTAPAVTNDSSQGYSIGSRWIDTVGGESYVCLSATIGASVWSKSTVGTIGEVANLQTTLDGKSATTHNHDTAYTGIAHGTNVSNPHAVTKTQVGLGSAENTTDLLKPISTATQAALDGKRELYSLGHPYAAGATTYGHTVTTSSQFNSDYAGWKAFQQNPSSGNEWATLGGVAASLMIELPSPIIFTRCALRGRVSDGEYATRWKLEGSNDGATFTMLLDKTLADESLRYSLGEKVFDFTNTVPYKFYRFNFTSWVGNNVGLNSIRWSHQGINILPTAINTLTSTSTTEALSAAQGKILQDGKYPVIVVGTIDANSTTLQDNTLYIGNNTGAATNTPGGWAWMLYNFKIGSWRHQVFQTASGQMYFRSVDGTFITNTWSKSAEVTDWTSFTPVITSESGTWSNYTATGKYKIIDKMMTVTFRVIFSNTPTAADALYVSLPPGMTMNTTVMTGGGGWDTDQVGVAILGDSGTVSGVPAIITTRTNQKVLVKYYNAAASSYLTCPGLSNTAPWTWTINDTVDGQFTVPIQ